MALDKWDKNRNQDGADYYQDLEDMAHAEQDAMDQEDGSAEWRFWLNGLRQEPSINHPRIEKKEEKK